MIIGTGTNACYLEVGGLETVPTALDYIGTKQGVLAFIGYKQTNTQTDKQSIYINQAFRVLHTHLLFQL